MRNHPCRSFLNTLTAHWQVRLLIEHSLVDCFYVGDHRIHYAKVPAQPLLWSLLCGKHVFFINLVEFLCCEEAVMTFSFRIQSEWR